MGSTHDDISLTLLSSSLHITHNWDQRRIYSASHAKREEGFTERWGEPQLDIDVHVANITLFQYRPAWEVQLALTISGLRFTVVNSPYACCETTGE
jgi:hypothetical protein